jgi:hypothetical protein
MRSTFQVSSVVGEVLHVGVSGSDRRFKSRLILSVLGIILEDWAAHHGCRPPSAIAVQLPPKTASAHGLYSDTPALSWPQIVTNSGGRPARFKDHDIERSIRSQLARQANQLASDPTFTRAPS